MLGLNVKMFLIKKQKKAGKQLIKKFNFQKVKLGKIMYYQQDWKLHAGKLLTLQADMIP